MAKQKLNEIIARDIVEARKAGIKVKEIIDAVGISEATYRRAMKKARDVYKIISEEKYDLLVKKPKLTKGLVKRIVRDRKKIKTYLEICEKYDISRPTFERAMKVGIKLGLEGITEEEDRKIREDIQESIFKIKCKKYGEKVARQMCSDGWWEGMGNNHNLLVEAGRARGKATQKYSPHVKANLYGREPYGHSEKPVYKEIEFHSWGELEMVLTFLELKIINKIKLGKNYQVDFGRKIVDLFVDNKIFEYHPPANGMCEENYKEKRVRDIKETGFNGPVNIIEKPGDLYPLLKEAGYVNHLKDYVPALKKAGEIIEKLKIPF